MDPKADKPRISVVTVMLNALDDFRLTAESVKNQTYRNLEYIVVDGGSTDGTQEYVAKNKHNISAYVSEADSGIYNAMNKAVRMCSGDFVIFMNAADEFASPTVIEEAITKTDTNADFIYGDRYRTEVNGVRTYEKAGDLSNILYTEVIYHQAVFNRRTVLLEHPYNENLQLAADYKFIVDRYMEGFNFQYAPIPICNFKSGGRSRQGFLMGASEAALAAFSHLKDKKEWKKTHFIKSISLNCCELYLNRALNDLTTNSNIKTHNVNSIIAIKNFERDPVTKGVLLRLLTKLNDEGYLISKRSCPKISVLTVVYNDKAGLLRTIQSLRRLNYPNLEFIVIDGNSIDGTKEVIDTNLDVIDVAVSETDNGIYDAMNKAIDLATGYYSIFMNAGDEFSDENVIDRIFLNNDFDDKFDVIYGNRKYISEKQASLQQAKSIDTINIRMPFCHQAIFTKTSALLKHKFDLTFKSAADYNQFIQLYKSGAKFKHVDTLVCNFYAGGTSEEGLTPYLESIKVQIDNFGLSDTRKNSAYYKAFCRNAENILRGS
ncbi:glycosyltransferase family 2 protein [Gilvimarinus japonicus]|uniref:Glycosyltransferase family 2 protein n=1 Tax=Gilvimarinus japonicus TaxID=1796469 RepID=A0ABV7HSQ2_9GAMM